MKQARWLLLWNRTRWGQWYQSFVAAGHRWLDNTQMVVDDDDRSIMTLSDVDSAVGDVCLGSVPPQAWADGLEGLQSIYRFFKIEHRSCSWGKWSALSRLQGRTICPPHRQGWSKLAYTRNVFWPSVHSRS